MGKIVQKLYNSRLKAIYNQLSLEYPYFRIVQLVNLKVPQRIVLKLRCCNNEVLEYHILLQQHLGFDFIRCF